MKTFVPKIMGNQDRNWYLIDAKDMVLGQLSTTVASILRGKNKPTFTPHLDLGDYVIVINAEKVKLSGNKLADKLYYSHSGYIGHLKTTSAKEMLEKDPVKVIELAVKGMIPLNKLKKDIVARLRLVVGPEHQYVAQKPQTLTI